MRRALATFLLALLSLDVHAETFQVTHLDDPSPDGCQPGDCSLREAMIAAASNDPLGPIDTINLPAGTYHLERGEFDQIRQPLRVRGAGPGQTRIASDDVSVDLFEVGEGGDLVLEDLELDSQKSALIGRPGSVFSLDNVVVLAGPVSIDPRASGRIRNSEIRRSLHCNGTVLVEDSTIFNYYQQITPAFDAPVATLRRVLVDNTPVPHSPVIMNSYAGTLTIERSTLVNAELWFWGAASVSISDSTITGSTVYLNNDDGNLDLRRVRYIDNTGPIRTESTATVTVEDSVFEGNRVRALYAAGGADWTISGSSFVNNRVDGNAGGAIVVEDNTTLRIRNSTFSGNSFTVQAASDGARGAAIGFRNGSGSHLILTHVTIVPPTVMPIGIVGTAIGGLGTGMTLDLSNSIVRGSCGMASSTLQNNAGNIESPGNTCGLDSEQNRVNIASASLALGPLGNHGGWTPTHLPASSSFAIDRASTPQCLPLDQRRLPRPGGVRCDVGAVEADADDTLFADDFEP